MRHDNESVNAVADCPWLGVGAGNYCAADYARDRAKLLEALRPGSPERLMFLANFPPSYDEAREARPRDTTPPSAHVGASNATH